MGKNGFRSISILISLMNRVDKIYEKMGFNTPSGYVQDRLRKSIENDENALLGGKENEKNFDNISR
jgi:metal-responsive CopG/Arc/MetJ family transcriptional regulator